MTSLMPQLYGCLEIGWSTLVADNMLLAYLNNFMAVKRGLEHARSCGQHSPRLCHTTLWLLREGWSTLVADNIQPRLCIQLYGCLENWLEHTLRTTALKLMHTTLWLFRDWLEHTCCGQQPSLMHTTLWLFPEIGWSTLLADNSPKAYVQLYGCLEIGWSTLVADNIPSLMPYNFMAVKRGLEHTSAHFLRTTYPRLCHNFMAVWSMLEHTSCGQQPSLMPYNFMAVRRMLEHTSCGQHTLAYAIQLYGCKEGLEHTCADNIPSLMPYNFMAARVWLEHTCADNNPRLCHTTLWLFRYWLEHTCCGQHTLAYAIQLYGCLERVGARNKLRTTYPRLCLQLYGC